MRRRFGMSSFSPPCALSDTWLRLPTRRCRRPCIALLCGGTVRLVLAAHLAGLIGQQGAPQPVVGETPPAEAASFEQPFADENATYPLGSTPLLTNEVKFDTLSDGTYNLTFREGRERSFQLGLPPDLLQALCAMLRAGAEHAQWNLALDYTPATTISAVSKSPLSRLH